MSGSEFLKNIETDYRHEYGKIPIIVASANLSSVETSSIKHSAGQMKKTLDFDTLYQAIEHHCGNPIK